jgi:hypothetical protein
VRFALLSVVPRVTIADLQRLAAACEPALAAVAAAWSPIFPEIVAPTIRVVSAVSDLTDDDVAGIFTDSLDEPGDLAYHYEKVGRDGKPHPYMLILADAYQPVPSWQQAGWHEMAETLVDPHCTRYDPSGWAVEVCDPVQSDNVDVGGVTLSPFVWPGWFELGVAVGAGARRVDSAGLLTAAHTVRPGGYAMRQDGSEITGAGYRHSASKTSQHSRRMKRHRAIAARARAGLRIDPQAVVPVLVDPLDALRRLG